MKKAFLALSAIIFPLIIIILLFFNPDYTIEKYDANIILNKDGSADVTETITYDFKRDFEFQYHMIPIKEIYDDEDESEYYYNEKYFPTSVKNTEVYYNGQKTTNAKIQNFKYDTYIKVFSPKKGIQTYTYKYTLTDLAVKYSDISEICWNFPTNTNDTFAKNVTVNIELAEPGNISDVFSRSGNKTQNKLENNKVTVTAEHLSRKEPITIRVLFNNDYINYDNPQLNKIFNKEAYNEIVEFENGLSIINIEIIPMDKTHTILAIIFILLPIIMMLYFYLKYDKETKLVSNEIEDISSLISPALASVIFKGKIDEEQFVTLTLQELINKKKIAIEKFDNTIKLILINNQGLDEYEAKIISILFNNKSEVLLDNLDIKYKKAGLQEISKIIDKLDKLKDSVMNTLYNNGFIDEKAGKKLKKLNLYAFINICLIIIAFFWGDIASIFFCTVFLAMPLLLLVNTTKGNNLYLLAGFILVNAVILVNVIVIIFFDDARKEVAKTFVINAFSICSLIAILLNLLLTSLNNKTKNTPKGNYVLKELMKIKNNNSIVGNSLYYKIVRKKNIQSDTYDDYDALYPKIKQILGTINEQKVNLEIHELNKHHRYYH